MKKMAKWKLVAAVAASSTMLSTVPVIADEAPAKDNKEATVEAKDQGDGNKEAPKDGEKKESTPVVEDPGAGETTESGKTNEDIKDDIDYALGRGEYQEEMTSESDFLKKPSADVPFKPEGQAPVTVNLTVNGEGRSNLPVQLLDSGVVAGEGFTDGRGRVTISTPPKDMGSFDMSLQFPKGLKFSNARCTTSGGYDEAKSREATKLAQEKAIADNDKNEGKVKEALKKAQDGLKQAEMEKQQFIDASKEMYGPTATDMLSYQPGVTIPLAERYDRIKKNEAFPSALLRAKVGKGEEAEKEKKEEEKKTSESPTTTKVLGDESNEGTGEGTGEGTTDPNAKEGETSGEVSEEATPTTENKKEEEEPQKPERYTKEQLEDYTIDLQAFNKFMADHSDITGKAIAEFNETYLVKGKSNITSDAGPAPKSASEIINSLNKAISDDNYFNSLKKSVDRLNNKEKEGSILGVGHAKNVEFLVYDTAKKIRDTRKKNPKLHGIELLEKEFSALRKSTNEKILYLVSWFDVGGATLKTTVPEALEAFAIMSFMSNVEKFTPSVEPEALGTAIGAKAMSITVPVPAPTSKDGTTKKRKQEYTAPPATTITKWAKTGRREEIEQGLYNDWGSWSRPFLELYGARAASVSTDKNNGIPWSLMTMNYWIQEKGTKQDKYDWMTYLKTVEYPQRELAFNKVTNNAVGDVASALQSIGGGASQLAGLAGPGPQTMLLQGAIGAGTALITGPMKSISEAVKKGEGRYAFNSMVSLSKMIRFYEEELGIGSYGNRSEADKILEEATKEYNRALQENGYKPIPAFVLEKKGPARAEAGADRNLVSFSTQTGATVDCSVDLNADEEEEDKIVGRDNRSQGGGVGNITMPTPVVNVEGGGKSGGMDEKTLASILDANNRQLSQALKDSRSSNSSNNSALQPVPNNAPIKSEKKNDREIIAGAGGPGAGAPAGVQAVGGASGAQGQAQNMSYGPKFGPSVETGGAVAKRGFFERIVDGIKSIF